MEHANEIRLSTIGPITFLLSRMETQVSELWEIAQTIPPMVQKDAVNNGLRLLGPVYWNYYGFTGDETKPFTLEIAVPVMLTGEKYTGNYELKTTDPFKCVTIRHEGAWNQIPESYARALAFIGDQQLQPTHINREVYIHADFQTPEANITEIQIGIV